MNIEEAKKISEWVKNLEDIEELIRKLDCLEIGELFIGTDKVKVKISKPLGKIIGSAIMSEKKRIEEKIEHLK